MCMAVWRQCRSQLKTERDTCTFVGGQIFNKLPCWKYKQSTHCLSFHLTDFGHSSSWKTLSQLCIMVSCERYLFLGEAVVSAVAVVVSVGANEISEGLLARAELPSWHLMTGAKHDCSGENDTGADGCVTEECFCFPIVIFHTFRSS